MEAFPKGVTGKYPVPAKRDGRVASFIFLTSLWIPPSGCIFLSMLLSIVISMKNNWSWYAASLRLNPYFLPWFRPRPVRSVEVLLCKGKNFYLNSHSLNQCHCASTHPSYPNKNWATLLNCSCCIEQQFRCQKEFFSQVVDFKWTCSKTEPWGKTKTAYLRHNRSNCGAPKADNEEERPFLDPTLIFEDKVCRFPHASFVLRVDL